MNESVSGSDLKSVRANVRVCAGECVCVRERESVCVWVGEIVSDKIISSEKSFFETVIFIIFASRLSRVSKMLQF